jgi:hypothetical protein
MREMSVAEQRYQAVLAVIAQGEKVKDLPPGGGSAGRVCIRGWAV